MLIYGGKHSHYRKIDQLIRTVNWDDVVQSQLLSLLSKGGLFNFLKFLSGSRKRTYRQDNENTLNFYYLIYIFP